MDTAQRLFELRDIERRLEAMLFDLEHPPICNDCGKPLICAHCEGRKGGLKASLLTTPEQRKENGRMGGRRRKRKLTVDPVTGAEVPITPQPTETIASAVDPAIQVRTDRDTLFKAEEVAQLIGVHPETLRHWRNKKRGPAYIKLDGHLVRYSLTAVLEWCENCTRNTGALSPKSE